jgi:FtsP/CotA-like multicopper oxidase with cupredoxin domain
MMKFLTRSRGWIAAAVPMLFLALPAGAQESTIYVQCPMSTELHPGDGITRPEEIKCMHLAAGDGMVTMADDIKKPLYIFSFSKVPLPGEAGAPVNQSEYAGFTMDYGALSANAPAPTITADEDDEVYLSLTNVGMVLRPDLSDPHTVHWHGFPNASSVFDGVPDASISINMGSTLTYFYHPVDAGTYMYHCHVEATEHMQMGMLGNLYVRPRQNKLADGTDLSTAFATNNANVINGGTTPAPAVDNGATHSAGNMYAYNDGDGTTRYDVEVPIQIGSFDADFHDASYAVQPLPFRSMKDDYFLFNGRGYPDTTNSSIISTLNDLGNTEESQAVSSHIEATAGQKVLLRISNLNVTQFNTIGTNGIPMQVIAQDARLLRDDAGNNMYYMTNSLTLGGGQSYDVLIDTTGRSGQKLYLYSKNLDQLANNTENFGGAMTEIVIN